MTRQAPPGMETLKKGDPLMSMTAGAQFGARPAIIAADFTMDAIADAYLVTVCEALRGTLFEITG